jgi:NADH dehydrogenase
MILVVGGTGLLGGMIARLLLERGEPVRILVRRNSPSEQLAKLGMATPAQSLVEAGAQPIFGDLKDPASLDAACQGAETVITTANSALRGGEDNVQTVDLQGNRRLIDAARAAGVSQFIFTSAIGASPDSPSDFLRAKGLTDPHLRDSGLTHTILMPNVFMEIWVPMVVGRPVMEGQPVTLVGEGRRRHSFVSMGDVANFAVAAVGHAAAMNQTLAIGGPEPVSWRDVVAAFARVLGREIPVRSVAPGEPVPGVPESALPLMAALETFDSPMDMAETARTFGVRLTTLEEVVRRLAA